MRKAKKKKKKQKGGGKLAGIMAALRYGYFDYGLLASVMLLMAFGLIVLYSTSSYSAAAIGDDMKYVGKQAAIACLGLAAAIVISAVDYKWLFQFSFVLYLASIILMVMVKVTPFGVTRNYAKRWLKIGLEFQPSEIAKIAVIVFIPAVIMKLGAKYRDYHRWKWFVFGLVLVPAVVCWQLNENLSTAIIIAGIGLAIIIVTHPHGKLLFAITCLCGIAAYFSAPLLASIESDSFRLARVRVWLNPEKYASGLGYQIMQGLYAIGSGGIFGKGLGNSTQKLGALPEAENDMIAAVICEELGLVGLILMLALFAYLIYRLVFIAFNSPDLYGTLMVAGIAAHISIQVILNLCVVMNIIPTTGVTLPFISYGGTAILFLMLELAIPLSVARRMRLGGEEGEEEREAKDRMPRKMQLN